MDHLTSDPTDHWNDDLLERRAWADRLYAVLMARFEAFHAMPDSEALCVAVDGDWGVGKTFFVERMQKDVENRGHIALRFDAWANDLSEDPLIGFISEMQLGLQPHIQQLHKTPKLRSIQSKWSRVRKSARKAIVPAAGVVAKGVLNYALAGGANDLIDAFDNSSETSEESGNKILREIQSTSAKAAQTFFDSTLKAHREKQDGIASFKKELSELLTELPAAKAPMFIFVDELDRCRPTYSVKLLESIKHIFSVPGVCFVLSTNISQLTSSVKAIYGAEFNGRRYLKKFLNFEYTLPSPDLLQLSRALVENSIIKKKSEAGKIKWHSGLPNEADNLSEKIAVPLAVVANSLNLDTRSMRQIFQHAEVCASLLADKEVTVGVFLFFLCAVHHTDASSMLDLLRENQIPKGTLPNEISLGTMRWTIKTGFTNESHLTLREILSKYLQWCTLTDYKIDEELQSASKPTHWDKHAVLRDTYADGRIHRPTLARLPRLIRYAEQFDAN